MLSVSLIQKVSPFQLLSVLTLSSEESDKADKAAAKDAVVARARKLYRDAKAMAPTRLLAEHTAGWAALWEGGECHDPHMQHRSLPRPGLRRAPAMMA